MKLLWIYLLILFVVIGCSKETDCTNSDCIEKDCIATMLTKNNMIKYTNDEIGCKMYLELFMYNNKQYFLLGSHCIYMVSYPMDCEGNTLFRNAKRIGFIGLWP